MKTLKYLAISVILTALLYIVFATESDSVDFRTWTDSAKILFVLATISVDFVLMELYRSKPKTA
jgi:hypothetical protein